MICVKILKRPNKASRYIPHSYVWVDPPEAVNLIDNGFAVEWNPEANTEWQQLLPQNFPARYKLFEAGIYTPEQLERTPEQFIIELDGVGEKKYESMMEELKDING